MPARGAGLNKATGGKGKVGEEGLWTTQEMWAEGARGCGMCFVAEIRMRLRYWVWGDRAE